MTPHALLAEYRSGRRTSLKRLDGKYWHAVYTELRRIGWYHGMVFYERTHPHEDVIALLTRAAPRPAPKGPRN